MIRTSFFIALALALALASGTSGAAVVTPANDTDVVETLPSATGSRAEERKLHRQSVANPSNAALAVELSRRYLDQARSNGDPRFAGQALAALRAWPEPAQAPDEVLLMQATLQQYLHEFDASDGLLELLVKRQPKHAQAWLTLATVRRVQGRYPASDAACAGLAAAGGGLHARACLAENQSLRGEFDVALGTLKALLATPRLPPQTRSWLLTTVAEIENRRGRAGLAEGSYRMALAAQADPYTILSYSDFLFEQERHADALALLKGQARTDAVLLRLAILGTRLKSVDAARDVREVRERMALAALRPDARATHAREQAMFALWVDAKPERALELARVNVRQQREPLDVLLLAQAARAASSAAGVQDAGRVQREMGLHDSRIDALR
jgi:hypothetical protein